MIQAIRDFFTGQDYLEVETPLRCPSIIVEAHIDPVTSEDFFLQASPELCMKRLMSQGMDKLFQISRCFRKSERGRRHLPELTLLEWYVMDQTYLDLMDTCENMILHISRKLNGSDRLKYQGKTIALEPPWQRLTVEQAFEQYADKSMTSAVSNNSFDEIISFDIEPHLGMDRPVFLYDYPRQYASLSRIKENNPALAQRFELYIDGIELANAFTELTDAGEQRKRFHEENHLRTANGLSRLPLPEKFLTDLENLPDAAGIALGIDRLAMLFCDTSVIDDVVTFTPEDL